MTNPLILIVEDDRAVAEVLGLVLESEDYKVVLASGGQEALSYLETTSPKPAAVLSDYRMRGLDGLQLYRAILARPHLAYIPFGITSGLRQDELPDELCDVPFMHKPFDVENVLSLISIMVNSAPKVPQAHLESQELQELQELQESQESPEPSVALGTSVPGRGNLWEAEAEVEVEMAPLFGALRGEVDRLLSEHNRLNVEQARIREMHEANLEGIALYKEQLRAAREDPRGWAVVWQDLFPIHSNLHKQRLNISKERDTLNGLLRQHRTAVADIREQLKAARKGRVR